MKNNRIINFFCVVGLGKKLQPQNQQLQKSSEEKSLTSLEIVRGPINEDITKKENEKWLDLDGSKQLWLRCIFDQNSKLITNIAFYHFQYEDDILVLFLITIQQKIPISVDYTPIPIKTKFDAQSRSIFKGISDGFSFYSGNYDLTSILGCDVQKGFQTVLCYRVQTQNNFQDPICDVQILKAERDNKRKANLSNEVRLIIPRDFCLLDYAFGNQEKNHYIAFKKKQSPLKIAYTPKLIDRYPLEDYPDQALLPSIPMFCFPDGIILVQQEEQPSVVTFNFILTSEVGARTYCQCLTLYERINQETLDQLGHVYISKDKQLFQPKTICFISNYSYTSQLKELLKQLYRLHMSKMEIPLERIICNMVDQIRLPESKAKNSVIKYDIGGNQVIFPFNQYYPFCSEESIKTLFKFFDTEKIIYLFECVLLEKKIHLISNHISIPGLIIEAMISLIFPFEYTHILVPVLPASLKNYIEAPVPFMIGYSQKNDQFNQPIQSDVEFQKIQIQSIYAYIDTNFVINIECLPNMPEKAYKKLRKRLNKYEHIYKEENSKKYQQKIDDAFNQRLLEDEIEELENQINVYDIRDAFYEFICTFMKDYQKFLVLKQKLQIQKRQLDFKDMFNLNSFLNHHKQNKEGTFLQRFTETRFFSYFIQERFSFSNNEWYYQFFDQSIEQRKRNKNISLIKQDAFQQVFTCPQPQPQPDIKGNKNQGSNEKDKYQYDCFPQLSPELFLKVHHDFQQEDQILSSINAEDQNQLENIENLKWAKYLLETIYKIWFQFFIIKVRNTWDNEQFEKLTDYAIFVIEEMKHRHLSVPESIFRSVLEACGYFRMDSKALYLVHQMKEMKIETSPSTHGVYFSSIAKAMNSKGLLQPFEQSEEQKNNVFEEAKCDRKLDKFEKPINPFVNTIFKINDLCPNCKKLQYFEEILDGFKKNFYDSNTRCFNTKECGKEFTAKFQITYFDDENPTESQIFDLYNPLNLLREIENLIKTKGETFLLQDFFEKQHKTLFMNIILYFDLIQVPFFFMCPKVQEESYNQNFSNLESKMKQQMTKLKSQNSVFSKIFKEFDIYKQELEKYGIKQQIMTLSDSSSGSNSNQGSTKFKVDQRQTNFASKAIKKVFGDFVKELSEKSEKDSNYNQKLQNAQFNAMSQQTRLIEMKQIE